MLIPHLFANFPKGFPLDARFFHREKWGFFVVNHGSAELGASPGLFTLAEQMESDGICPAARGKCSQETC